MTGYMAYAAVANALKATGVVVRMEPGEFSALVGRADKPVVVVAEGGMFRKRFRYLTSYKGLAFYAESPSMLPLPRAEVITARSISIPDA